MSKKQHYREYMRYKHCLRYQNSTEPNTSAPDFQEAHLALTLNLTVNKEFQSKTFQSAREWNLFLEIYWGKRARTKGWKTQYGDCQLKISIHDQPESSQFYKRTGLKHGYQDSWPCDCKMSVHEKINALSVLVETISNSLVDLWAFLLWAFRERGEKQMKRK